MLRLKTSSARIVCRSTTVICRVRLAQLLAGTLFPITAKLWEHPFRRTQQPAVHKELGTSISCDNWSTGTPWIPRMFLFCCCSILAKEVPFKRYKVPSCRAHVSSTYRRIRPLSQMWTKHHCSMFHIVAQRLCTYK